jgi:hypothetical protein
VVALPTGEVAEILAQARVLLEAALIAEILVHEGPYSCPERVALLRGRTEPINDDLREDLVRHSLGCRLCVRRLPGSIAPAKVCALLPDVTPPDTLRAEMMNCFTDADPVGFRRSVAARVRSFDRHGFPAQPWAGRAAAHRRAAHRRGARHRAARRWPHAATALSGAVLAALSTGAICNWLAQEGAGGPDDVFAGPPAGKAPRPRPAPNAAHPISATYPLGAHPPGPAFAMDRPIPENLLRASPPARLRIWPYRLTLGPARTGTLALEAVGEDIAWRVSSDGPLRAAPAQGTLGAGRTSTIRVRVRAAGPGDGTLTFEPGAVRIPVSWAGTTRPSSPPPSSPPPTSPPSSSSPPNSPDPSSPPPSSSPPTTPPPSSPPPTAPPATPSPAPPPAVSPRPTADGR